MEIIKNFTLKNFCDSASNGACWSSCPTAQQGRNFTF